MHTLNVILLSALLAVAVVVLSAMPAAAATYSATEDAFTRGERPNTNYGTQTIVRAQIWAETTGFVKFNLGSLSGMTISSATLRIPVEEVRKAGWIKLHRVLGGWNETGITHSTKPSISSAQSGFYAGSGSAGATVNVDVTNLVQQMLHNGSNSIALSTSNGNIATGSRDGGSPIRLDVTTSSSGGGSTGSSIDLTAIADAYTTPYRPSDNFGGLHRVRSMLWGPIIGFARFDLGRVPSGSEVDSATLRIRIAEVLQAGSLSIHRVTADWDEYGITHGSKPSMGPALASFSVAESDAGSTVTVNATSFARNLLNNRSNDYGIAVVANNGAIAMSSREVGPAMRLEISTSASGSDDSNSLPTISGNPPGTVVANSSYGFTPQIADADGDSLTTSIRNKPNWASFNSGTARIYGVPSEGDVGVHGDISITVSDGQASDTLGPFSIEVTEDGSGSVTLRWDNPTRNTDGSTLRDLAQIRLDWTRTNDGKKGSVTINNPSVSSYVFNNLAAGYYRFTAVAINDGGDASAPSNAASKSVQ